MGGLLIADAARDIVANTRADDPIWPKVVGIMGECSFRFIRFSFLSSKSAFDTPVGPSTLPLNRAAPSHLPPFHVETMANPVCSI